MLQAGYLEPITSVTKVQRGNVGASVQLSGCARRFRNADLLGGKTLKERLTLKELKKEPRGDARPRF